MAQRIPATSVSLIRALSDDPQSVRWAELYKRYKEPMLGFLKAKFPSLEPEDVIQETMMVLAKRLPDYRYTPDEKGHFRNYLMGILKHKAADAIARRNKEANVRERLKMEPRDGGRRWEDDEWRVSALEVAISQLMADESVNALHRTVFRHVVLSHETPEEVAAKFGISRNNVDQIKRRLTARLAEAVRKMTD